MKKTAFNPYLPTWEYVPDAEPHVFNGRVYIYGSHDIPGGTKYCLGDYVSWSAPVDDLSDWRYEGVSYRKGQDAITQGGEYEMAAPDTAQGPDGRYYMYYCVHFLGEISVAVADQPQGPYSFLGYVRNKDGSKLDGSLKFDPAVLVEEGGNYLYYGFCPSMHFDDMPAVNTGASMVRLADDMITAVSEPVYVARGWEGRQGTSFEEHPFYEASSIRHIGRWYYFVYSSIQGNELCYAMSDRPEGPFEYKGVIVSNCDLGYEGNTVEKHTNANNHGGILSINGQHYIFYHRHTHDTHFSRQACAEKIEIDENGLIRQAECTSCGLNDGWIIPEGTFNACIACNLIGDPHPYQMEEEDKDGEQRRNQYIRRLMNGSLAVVKYFDFDQYQPETLSAELRYGKGTLKILLDEKEVLAETAYEKTQFWKEWSVRLPKITGVHSIAFCFESEEETEFNTFRFE